MMRRIALLGLAASVLAGAAGAGEEVGKLRRSEIEIGGEAVTVVEYEGRTYRMISPSDLAARPGAAGHRFAGQLCCIEGKYRSAMAGKIRLYGSETGFPAAPALIRGLAAGDNVLLAGTVRPLAGGAGGAPRAATLAVTAVVRLGTDAEIFERRFARFQKGGRAEALVALAAWIKGAKEASGGLAFGEFERYDRMHGRALREALRLLEAGLDAKDAEGFYRLALRTLELVNDEAAATRLFLRAAAADPNHAGTVERLTAAGLVRIGERWVTADERDRLLAEEEKRREAERLAAEKARKAALDSARGDAAAAAAQCAAVERELARAASPGEALLGSLGGNKMLVASRLHVLELAARLPGKEALKVLLAGTRDDNPSVRARGVDLLAVRPEPEARKALETAARKNADGATALRAVEALAWAEDRAARAALAELLACERKSVATAARAALVRLAGRDLGADVEAWRKWAEGAAGGGGGGGAQ